MVEYTFKMKLSFIAATMTMAVICIASSSAIPFYATYQSYMVFQIVFFQ
ncbi:hypothetical protein [Methanosphaera sp.]